MNFMRKGEIIKKEESNNKWFIEDYVDTKILPIESVISKPKELMAKIIKNTKRTFKKKVEAKPTVENEQFDMKKYINTRKAKK